MQKIVVGVDGSVASNDALSWAQNLASRNGAVVHVVTAWMMPTGWGAGGGGSADLIGQLEDGARFLLRQSLDAVPELDGVTRTSEIAMGVSASGGLISAAADADLLVVGTRAHSRFERVVGSVAIQCAQHAPCPFIAVPASPPPLGDVIAVAYDRSENAQPALEWAAQAAINATATLRVIAVWEEKGWKGSVRIADDQVDPGDRAVQELKAAVESALSKLPTKMEYRAVHGPEKVAPHLIEAADGASILAVGSRGRGGFTGLLLGSVSQRCLEASPIPVAVIRD